MPLRFAFLLDGFGDSTRFRPFQAGPGEIRRLRCLSGDITASWGDSPGRQLMKLLTAISVLSDLTCYLVDLGPPLEAALAIQGVLEASCS
jgi:hypothetical protein